MSAGGVSSERKAVLVSQVRALADRLGRVPGIREFLKESGAKKHLWDGSLWPSWNAFLDEAGLATNALTQAFADDEMLLRLAQLTREHGRFPTVRELKYARVKDATIPAEKTYRNRFRTQGEMVSRLRTWVAGREEWRDVEPLLASASTDESTAETSTRAAPSPSTTAHPLLSDSFIPPVIYALPEIASGQPEVVAECRARGLDPNVEFERRVAISFQLLGLEVDRLGQGAGRVADGVAKSRIGRWGLIFDAKLRRGGFTIGTEDRKFREYIERHGKALADDGIDNVYFGVVSSAFSEKDLERAQELVHATTAKACVLIEARALRSLVELRLQGHLADGERLKRIVGVTRILTDTLLTDVRR